MPRFTVLNLLRPAGAFVFLVTAYLIPRAIIPMAIIAIISYGLYALHNSNWEAKDKLAAFGVLLAVCTFIANQPTAKDYIASFGIQQPVQNAHAMKTFTIENSIENSAHFVCTHNTLTKPVIPCLDRPQYDEYNLLNRNGSDQVLVFGGAKGTGKSSLVQCMLQNVTKGVVQIRTNVHVQNQTPLTCQILKFMKFIEPPSADEDCMLVLQDLLKRAADCLGRKAILVVEAFTRASDVSEIFTPLRKITFDHPLATTALVLSDALAAFSLKSDDRWDLTFVDEFTDAEAIQYLDNRKCLVGNATARTILLNTTTLGMYLHAFVQSNKSVEQFTRERLRHAGGVISSLINVDNTIPKLSGPAFQKLVCMLLEDEYKDGVSLQIANEFLAAPSKAAAILKEAHALLYHMPSETYRFHSRTIRQAALEMKAEKKICQA